MKYIIVAAILLATPAFAQDAPKPDGAPAASGPAPTEWYLKIDQQGINTLSQCIQELPKKVADPFLFNLDAQLKTQPAIIASIKAK
jgi:hypothetical protein